jgi:hypothetical protein
MKVIDPKVIAKYERLIKEGKKPTEALQLIKDDLLPNVKEEVRVYGPKAHGPKPFSANNWKKEK